MIAFFCAFAVLAADSGLEMVARHRAKVLASWHPKLTLSVPQTGTEDAPRLWPTL